MIRGYAVRQCVRTTGIFRYIAANGAGPLTGGIRRIVVSKRGRRMRQFQVHDTWLYHSALIFNIQFENAIHAREGDNHAALNGDRTAA